MLASFEVHGGEEFYVYDAFSVAPDIFNCLASDSSKPRDVSAHFQRDPVTTRSATKFRQAANSALTGI